MSRFPKNKYFSKKNCLLFGLRLFIKRLTNLFLKIKSNLSSRVKISKTHNTRINEKNKIPKHGRLSATFSQHFLKLFLNLFRKFLAKR